ncbi:MAG: oligosaccharide flippase family protein [Clostridium sp.]
MSKIKSFLSQNSLLNSALWYTVGTFLLKGINFLTMPIFTSLLGDSGFGTMSLYSTWSSIFAVFIGLGISGTISSAAVNIDKDEYDQYLSSTLFLSTISFIVVMILFLIFKNPLTNFIGFSSNLIILLIVQSFFSFVIDFVSSKFVFDKNHRSYLIVSAIVTFINVGLSIMLISNINSPDEKYFGRIFGMAISTILVGIILYIKIILKGKKLVAMNHWKFCIPLALPIIFHNLSHLVLTQADRIMLDKFTTDAAVGLYSVAYNVGMMLNVLHMALNNSWVAWYFDALKGNKVKEIKETAKKYIIVFTVITCLFVLASPEVLKIMSSKEFWGSAIQIPMIILGYYFVFLYTFSVNYEFYIKNTKFIAIGSVLASISNVVLNLILIPKYAGFGAAIATAVSYFMLFIIHEFIVRVIYKHRDFKFNLYIYSIGAVTAVMIINAIFINSLIIRLIIGLIILGIAAIYAKKNLLNFK